MARIYTSRELQRSLRRLPRLHTMTRLSSLLGTRSTYSLQSKSLCVLSMFRLESASRPGLARLLDIMRSKRRGYHPRVCSSYPSRERERLPIPTSRWQLSGLQAPLDEGSMLVSNGVGYRHRLRLSLLTTNESHISTAAGLPGSEREFSIIIKVEPVDTHNSCCNVTLTPGEGSRWLYQDTTLGQKIKSAECRSLILRRPA